MDIGSRFYVSGLFVDARVVALMGIRTPFDLIITQAVSGQKGSQILGRILIRSMQLSQLRSMSEVGFLNCLHFNSMAIKALFVSQDTPGNARQFVGKRDSDFVPVHSL